jgi:hypothetical protein
MANVTFTPNPQPEPACYPSDVNGLLTLLTTGGGISGTIPDTAGGGIFVGSSPPSSALTNKVWYKTDAGGRPLGVYMFYNGNWRKVYTGAAYGEIRAFWFYSGQIDGTGRGNVGGDMDGWALCNGQNGAPNLEGSMLVCGAQGEAVGGAAGQWFTDAEGTWKNNGGAKGPHIIAAAHLPHLLAPVYGHFSGMFNSAGNGFSWTSGHTNDPGNLIDYDDVLADGQTTANPPHTPLPFQPYYAIGYFMFVGYA